MQRAGPSYASTEALDDGRYHSENNPIVRYLKDNVLRRASNEQLAALLESRGDLQLPSAPAGVMSKVAKSKEPPCAREMEGA